MERRRRGEISRVGTEVMVLKGRERDFVQPVLSSQYYACRNQNRLNGFCRWPNSTVLLKRSFVALWFSLDLIASSYKPPRDLRPVPAKSTSGIQVLLICTASIKRTRFVLLCSFPHFAMKTMLFSKFSQQKQSLTSTSLSNSIYSCLTLKPPPPPPPPLPSLTAFSQPAIPVESIGSNPPV